MADEAGESRRPLLPTSGSENVDQDSDLKLLLPQYSWYDYFVAASAYSLCAASLLVINKASVNQLPSPAIVVAAQLLFSAVIARALLACGIVEGEPLRFDLVRNSSQWRYYLRYV